MKLSNKFVAPWPTVLVEIQDFVDMVRLLYGGNYTALAVRIVISKTAPAEWLNLPAFQQFRAVIEATPGIQVEFTAAETSAHRVDIEIQR